MDHETHTWTTPFVRTELPGPRSRELIDRLDRVISGVLRGPEVPFVEASKTGWLITDVDGNTFADHHSSWGSAPLGADHPAVLEAVLEAQRRYGMECTDYVRSKIAVELAERLVEIAPPGITRVCHQITGTEAVEGGVKLARAATGRPMILTFYGQYHGESTYLTAAGSTDLSDVPAGHAQYVAGLVFAPYPNPFRAPFHRGPGPYDDTIYLDYLEEHVLVHQVEPEQIAGVLIEPVLGEGGIIAPSPAFWQRLQQMCARWGWKLILDEVQTCMGRCGTMFAAERYDIRPDILLLGKALSGGGQPIAAVMATEEIMAETDLHLGGTYSWTPAAAAGALAGIDAILADGAMDNAMELERIALEELGPLVGRIEQVGDVRAAGALLGVEFVRDMDSIAPAPNFHRRVHEAAVRRGVLGITQGGKWVYRLQPALNMPPELFRWSCRQVAEAIEEVAADPPGEPVKMIERDAPDVIEV